VPSQVERTSPLGVRKGNLFRHPEAHPLVLDMALLQRYGPDWLTWEADTIEYRIEEDERYEMSAINLSKLEAVRTMHMVDSFWEQWEVFVWCTMPMNGTFPDFDVMQVPTVFQCMNAVHTSTRIRTDVAWSSEVKEFLTQVHRHDEVLVPQNPLEFVELDLEGYPVNVERIRSLWPTVMKEGKVLDDDTPESEQLQKMLELHSFLKDARAELRSQLEVVLNA